MGGVPVVTGQATSVGARSAIVSGRVDPRGESTSWYVEYGRTTAYGGKSGSGSVARTTATVIATTKSANDWPAAVP